ncbi:MAG: YkvA family protein [Ahrensia sp.]|nr:YkvA family protein [Ahrensia sp.]
MSEEKIIEILEPGSHQEQKSREERVREKFWATAKKAARNVPMMQEITAAYYCALDNETPMRVRGTLLAALAYFILPLDMLPDFIAGFGFTDDIAVITAAIAAVRTNITDAHRSAAKRALSDEGFSDDL